jgi:hypothetical protein
VSGCRSRASSEAAFAGIIVGRALCAEDAFLVVWKKREDERIIFMVRGSGRVRVRMGVRKTVVVLVVV